MKNAAAYLRRSTDDKQADSIEIQREEVELYASQNGYRIVRFYIDDGISGHNVDRDEFVRMIEDAERTDDFEFVLVRHQSRFARFRPAKTIRYLDRLDDAGVRLVTSKQGEIDVNDLAQFLMASIEAQTDHTFSRTLSELTIRGQARKAKEGYSAGQAAPYGYDRMLVDENGEHRQLVSSGEKVAKPDGWHTTFVPGDSSKVAVVKTIFAQFLDGKSPWSIAKHLNDCGIPSPRGKKWNKGTIRSMLENRIYAGDFQWNKRREGKFHCLQNGQAAPRPRSEETPKKSGRRKNAVFQNDREDWLIVENTHEAVIPKTEWLEVQNILHKTGGKPHPNRGNAASGGYRYALSGLVYCECGAKMHGRIFRRRKKGKEYTQRKYVCSAYDSSGTCRFNWADAETLHNRVVDALCERLRDDTTIDRLVRIINRQLSGPSDLTPRIQQLTAKIADLDQKIETGATKLLLCDADLTAELSAVLREFKQQRSAVEAEIQSLRSQEEVRGSSDWSHEDVVEGLANLADRLETVPNEELQQIMKNTIDRVELRFKTIDGDKSRLSAGEIHISKSTDSRMAGAGFEPTTSRL